MLAVVSSLGSAGIGASLRGVALALAEREKLIAHVCVVAVVEWGINGSAKFRWAAVAATGWGRGVFIVS